MAKRRKQIIQVNGTQIVREVKVCLKNIMEVKGRVSNGDDAEREICKWHRPGIVSPTEVAEFSKSNYFLKHHR